MTGGEWMGALGSHRIICVTRSHSALPADVVIEAYKQSVDVTLLKENLRRTPEERIRQLQSLQRFAEELARAGAELRRHQRR